MTSNRIPSIPRDFRSPGLRDDGQYLTQLNNLFRPCGLFADRRYDGLLYVGELPPDLPVGAEVPNLGARVSIVPFKGDRIGYGGKVVSELEHALQCAELAREGGADEELQLACLLHDVGRYAVDQPLVSDTTEWTAVGSSARGHHEVGAGLLAPSVPARVTWCVRMHADAKRYLCATEPDYVERLSPVSRRTLELQDGIMSPSAAARFAEHPWLRDALALRRCDDQAKVKGAPTRSLAEWAPVIRRYVR